MGFEHLVEQYLDDIEPLKFEVMHRVQLDPKLSPGDSVFFVRVEGAPYLIGDFNKAHPSGVLEPAVVAEMRDLIWLDNEYAIVGPLYDWKDQYLCDITMKAESKAGRRQSRSTLERILYDQPVEALGGVHLGHVVCFRDRTRPVELQILREISPKAEVYIAGRRGLVVREGMGASFQMPVAISNLSPALSQICGRIIGFRRSHEVESPLIIRIEVYLGNNNIPSWMLSRLSGSQQLQTNQRLAISEQYLDGVFTYWPACLLQGTCAPAVRGLAHDKVVVGDMQIRHRSKSHDPSGSASSAHDDSESGSDSDLSEHASITSTCFHDDERDLAGNDVRKVLAPLLGIQNGESFVEIRAVAQLRPTSVLPFFALQDKILPQVSQTTLHF